MKTSAPIAPRHRFEATHRDGAAGTPLAMPVRMQRFLLGSLLCALAITHAIAGSKMADPESTTLLIEGLGSTARWVATQLLGASIAGYAIAAFASFAFMVPTSWKRPAAVIAAASSLLLTCLVWRGGLSWPLLAMVDIGLALTCVRRVAFSRATSFAR